MTVNMLVCAVLTVTGLLFMAASLIGIAKLPDFFTRLHAQGVGDTIGAFLILAGMMAAAWGGLLPVKILLIFIVIVLTNPIGTNLMMIAAINKEDYLGYRTKMSGETADAEPSDAGDLSRSESVKSEPDNRGRQAEAVRSEAVEEEQKPSEPESDKTDDEKVRETAGSETQRNNKTKNNKGKGNRRNNRSRKPKPSMKMNKAELIKAAESRGITVPEKATKREILDLIYNQKN